MQKRTDVRRVPRGRRRRSASAVVAQIVHLPVDARLESARDVRSIPVFHHVTTGLVFRVFCRRDRRRAVRGKTGPGVDKVFHVILPVRDFRLPVGAAGTEHELELSDHPAGAQRSRHLPVHGDSLRSDRGIETHAVLHERAEVKTQLVASALARDPIQHVRGVGVESVQPRQRVFQQAPRVFVREHARVARPRRARYGVARLLTRARPRLGLVSFLLRVPHHVRGRHGPRQVPHDFPPEAVQMGTHVVPRGPRARRLAASVAADAFRALAGRVQVTPHRVRPGVSSVAVARRPRPLTTERRFSGS